MYMYQEYHYGGMHLFWWFLWIFLLIWIFVIPYNIPGQRLKKDGHLEVLKNRLASGEIDNKDYLEKKKLLEHK